MTKIVVYTLYANNGVVSCQSFATMNAAIEKAQELNAVLGAQVWHVKQVMKYVW